MRFASGERVLLAEDSIDNQRLLSHVLTHAGFQVTVVENGQVACDRAMAAVRDGTPFDLILMDMRMPVLSPQRSTPQAVRESGQSADMLAYVASCRAGAVRLEKLVRTPIWRPESLPVARCHD